MKTISFNLFHILYLYKFIILCKTILSSSFEIFSLHHIMKGSYVFGMNPACLLIQEYYKKRIMRSARVQFGTSFEQFSSISN